MIKNKRILYLDGLKGISCLFIFFHHFMLAFFPATYYGATHTSFLYQFDTFLSSSPLGIIVNGNFFVHIFILISGYVITSQIINMQHEKLGFFQLKRYLKLVFPLGVYSFLCFVLNFINGTYGLDYKKILKAIYKLFVALFIGILFKGENYLRPHLWMLNYIFIGGIFVSVISALCWYFDGKKVFFVPLSLGFILFLQPSLENIHWATVFWGCALCLFNSYYHANLKKFVFPMVLATLFLGAFPSGVMPQNFYQYLVFPYKESNSCFYWHSIASALLILSVTNSKELQTLFSKTIFIKLSSISLWVYLLHGEIINIATKFISIFNLQSYIINASCIFVTSFILLIFISHLFAKYISPIGIRLIDIILNFLETSEAKSENKKEDLQN